MLQFVVTILKFGKQGEKTGWTYIQVSQKLAYELKENNKKSFRVKGKLDEYEIHGIALLPMGNGDFIMPLNATIRKGIKKRKGATLNVCIEVDDSPVLPSVELIECLRDDPNALINYNKLSKSHQNYYSKWVDSARTESTKTKRITQAVIALSHNLNYGEMMRALKSNKD